MLFSHSYQLLQICIVAEFILIISAVPRKNYINNKGKGAGMEFDRL